MDEFCTIKVEVSKLMISTLYIARYNFEQFPFDHSANSMLSRSRFNVVTVAEIDNLICFAGVLRIQDCVA